MKLNSASLEHSDLCYKLKAFASPLGWRKRAWGARESNNVFHFLHWFSQKNELQEMWSPLYTLISNKIQKILWWTENLNHKHSNKNSSLPSFFGGVKLSQPRRYGLIDKYQNRNQGSQGGAQSLLPL